MIVLCSQFRMIFVMLACENVRGHTAGFLGLQLVLVMVPVSMHFTFRKRKFNTLFWEDWLVPAGLPALISFFCIGKQCCQVSSRLKCCLGILLSKLGVGKSWWWFHGGGTSGQHDLDAIQCRSPIGHCKCEIK